MKSIKLLMNHICVVVACLFATIPYFLMTISTFNTSVDIRKGDIFSNASINKWIDNFINITKNNNFIVALKNSILIAIISAIIGVFLASLAGYAYITYRNKLMDKLFNLSFFSIMIPSSVLVIPLFMLLNTFSMLDSLISVILVSLSLPFLIYLFRQNTKLFPIELIKAARIDGLNEIAIFFKIYIPNVIAVFVTSVLIMFISTWNSLLYPLVIIQSQNKMTLTVYINSIGSSQTSDYGAFMIALIISTYPILAMFLIAQKYFRVGLKTM